MRVYGKNKFADFVPYNLPGSQKSTGKIMKHRYIAQQLLGRVLKPGECVVRRDGNRGNCDETNIMVFASKSGARRWYSSASEKFLIKREDGVYDYDWNEVKKEKETEKHYQNLAEKTKNVKKWIEEHPEATAKEIAEEFDIKFGSIYNFLRRNGLKAANGSTYDENIILTWPRKEVIALVDSYENKDDLIEALGMSKNRVNMALKRRGISLDGHHERFKHLNKEELQQATDRGLKVKEMNELFDTFEENVSVELKRHNIESDRRSAFAASPTYIMPEEDEYLKEPEIPEPVEEVQEPEVQETKDIEQDSYLFSPQKFCDLNNVFLYDIPFIFGKSLFEFISNEVPYTVDEIIEYEETAKNLCKARLILTTENILALFEAGHDEQEISYIYNINISMVQHIISHI